MSFDVYLQHFERGLPAEADRAAVAAVLRGLEATGPDTSGHYHVRVNDLWTLVKSRHSPVTELEIVGASEAVPGPGREPYILAISVGDLEAEEEFRGCAFFLHAFSPGIAEVIFRIAEAGGMAIIPAAEIGPLLPPTADPGDLPEDLSQAHRIASGTELFSLLSTDYGRYASWRDRVIGGTASRRRLSPRLARSIRGLRWIWPVKR